MKVMDFYKKANPLFTVGGCDPTVSTNWAVRYMLLYDDQCDMCTGDFTVHLT